LLALCLLAFLTRSQAIVLIPAVATAPLVLAWLDQRRLRLLAGFKAIGDDLPKFATGDLLRDAVKRKTPLGLKAKAVMEASEELAAELRAIVEEIEQGEAATART